MLLPRTCLRHPRIENGEIKVESDQHIDVPHVACDIRKIVWNVEHPRTCRTEGLTRGFGPREKEGDGIGTEAQQPQDKGKKIIATRPDQERPKDTRNAAGIETAHGHRTTLLQGFAGTTEEEGTRKHDENGDTRAHNSTPNGAPTGKIRVAFTAAIRGGSIERVAGVARNQKEKGNKTQKVEMHIAGSLVDGHGNMKEIDGQNEINTTLLYIIVRAIFSGSC